jgi:hypothetical protein
MDAALSLGSEHARKSDSHIRDAESHMACVMLCTHLIKGRRRILLLCNLTPGLVDAVAQIVKHTFKTDAKFCDFGALHGPHRLVQVKTSEQLLLAAQSLEWDYTKPVVRELDVILAPRDINATLDESWYVIRQQQLNWV